MRRRDEIGEVIYFQVLRRCANASGTGAVNVCGDPVAPGMVMQYGFWLEFSRFFLIPVSLYLNLIAPVFVDETLFEADSEDLLNNYYEDPVPIYGPCTSLHLTPFGREVFAEAEIWA